MQTAATEQATRPCQKPVHNSHVIYVRQCHQQRHVERHAHPTEPFNNTDLYMTERAEGRYGVSDGVDSMRGVGNGVDGGRFDDVDDDRGMMVQESKQPEHYYSTCNPNVRS